MFDDVGMAFELVADRGSDEISPVGVETVLHHQVDMAKIDVPEIDRDLLGVARLGSQLITFSPYASIPTSVWMVYGWKLSRSRGSERREALGKVPSRRARLERGSVSSLRKLCFFDAAKAAIVAFHFFLIAGGTANRQLVQQSPRRVWINSCLRGKNACRVGGPHARDYSRKLLVVGLLVGTSGSVSRGRH